MSDQFKTYLQYIDIIYLLTSIKSVNIYILICVAKYVLGNISTFLHISFFFTYSLDISLCLFLSPPMSLSLSSFALKNPTHYLDIPGSLVSFYFKYTWRSHWIWLIYTKIPKGARFFLLYGRQFWLFFSLARVFHILAIFFRINQKLLVILKRNWCEIKRKA